MLYWLHQTFDINILGYITIRAGISFFIALFFTLFLMPYFIRWAQRTSKVQPINEWAPQRHKEKASTPTMGGIVFIVATIFASLLSIKFSNVYAVGGILTLLLFALIGFEDDYAKVKKNENLAGLKARTKFFLQISSALLLSVYLCIFADFNTDLYIPFMKSPLVDMGVFAIALWVLVIVATSNAVNLTDGLDGLATVPSLTALSSFVIILYITGDANLSAYLL
ncbi:MAG: phospho-N-acetylmuramoyl-pentapeptide-transferase, partial [Sulfurimonas sp.]|nr:phospho-N-acetylmuramoyl-pentapeptide-transferase [Sulfurimonas sp.]